MGRSTKYYGFRITDEGFWELHAVLSDGTEDVIKESFDKDFITNECKRLNKSISN